MGANWLMASSDYLSKAPPLNTITLGVRALIYAFGRDTDIRFIISSENKARDKSYCHGGCHKPSV